MRIEALTSLSSWRRHGVAFLLGAATVLGLPPVDAWPVTFLTLPLLYCCLEPAESRKAAFGTGWWFGFGYLAVGWYWISDALLVFSDRFWWMVPFVLIGLPGVMALYYGIAGLVWCEFARRTGAARLSRVLVLAAVLAAADMLRGHLFTGFPWNTFGYVWSGNEALSQGASVVGLYGLGLAVLISGLLPAAALGAGGRRRAALLGLAAAVPAAAFAFGTVRLAGLPDMATQQADPGLPGLRLVQVNVPQREKWRRTLTLRNFEWHLTDSMADRPDWVDAVIWPETAAAFFIENRHDLRAVAGRLAAPPGGYLLTGAPRRPDGAALYNSLVVLDDIGRVRATYDKAHLVPFGEYMPLGSLMPFGKVTVGAVDYTPGSGPRTLDLPGLPPFSPLICYEAIFPGAVTDPDHRPAWLLNLTNDAWYGETAGPYQHLRAARMRAVEEGLPLVRAANTGVSGAFDAYGREIGRIGLSRRGTLDFRLPPPAAETVFARYGNEIALLLICTVAVIGGAVTKS